MLILTDIFENFRKICHQINNIDAAWPSTVAGLAYEAMLKTTNVKLELITDYNMILFFEAGIRDGLIQCIQQYSKADNKCIVNNLTDCRNDPKYITYLDANNL